MSRLFAEREFITFGIRIDLPALIFFQITFARKANDSRCRAFYAIFFPGSLVYSLLRVVTDNVKC
jgi:hypothetical protein